MGKTNDAFQYLATTGTGIAIGTNIDLAGVVRCSDVAGTIILKAGASTILTMSADRAINFTIPIAISGPVTMTSSAGDSFLVAFRKRSV
jgi:hypothetical protein